LHEEGFVITLAHVKFRPMNPSLIDPHNCIPEVTPDDVWGDPEFLQSGYQSGATFLPPKRAKAESASSAAVSDSEGLRIEVRELHREAGKSGHQLEVQEIQGSVLRLDPEIPAVSPVPRQINFHHRPSVIAPIAALRGEGKEWGVSRRHSFRWILGTGMGVVTVVVGAMLLLPMVNKSNAARPSPGLVLDPEEEINGAESLNEMLSMQPEAEQIFRKFASAAIVNEVFPLVWDLKSVEPLIRLNHRPATVSPNWVPAEDTTWSVFDSGGATCGLLEGSLPDFSRFSAYFRCSESRLYLDWKATTCYGTATFDELEKGTGNPAEIRARIMPAVFFTIAFPETEYRSYQLISPDNGKAIWCYTRRGEAVNESILKLFRGGEILESTPEPKKVTLRLERGHADSLPNHWLIAEMLHNDWIIP
jgi:hypothetical protein